jgi:hypothetical protein
MGIGSSDTEQLPTHMSTEEWQVWPWSCFPLAILQWLKENATSVYGCCITTTVLHLEQLLLPLETKLCQFENR